LLAYSYILENNFVEAEKYAKNSLSNKFEYSYLLYGKIQFQNKKYKDANESLNYFVEKIHKFKKFFREICEAYYYIANMYFKADNFNKARNFLKKAIKLKEDKKFYNDIAVVLIRLGHFFKARLYLNKSLNLDRFYKCSIFNRNQLNKIIKKLTIKYSILCFLVFIAVSTIIMGREYADFTIIILLIIIAFFFSIKPRLTFGIRYKYLKLEISNEFDFNIDEKRIPLILSMYEEDELV